MEQHTLKLRLIYSTHIVLLTFRPSSVRFEVGRRADKMNNAGTVSKNIKIIIPQINAVLPLLSWRFKLAFA